MKPVIQRVADLLDACGTEQAVMPATELYNEGWLLRLVLDWYWRQKRERGRVYFASGAIWYSEALLPSRFFRAAKREGYTHADAVIGQLDIGRPRGDARLRPDATQFWVIEAKMASPLAKGVKYAPTFNQAARNVACMLHLLTKTGQEDTLEDLAFFVFAPGPRIAEGYFSVALEKPGITQAIRARDEENSEHLAWCDRHLDAIVDRMRIEVVSWEVLLEEIASEDGEYGNALLAFYSKCCEHNGL